MKYLRIVTFVWFEHVVNDADSLFAWLNSHQCIYSVLSKYLFETFVRLLIIMTLYCWLTRLIFTTICLSVYLLLSLNLLSRKSCALRIVYILVGNVYLLHLLCLNNSIFSLKIISSSSFGNSWRHYIFLMVVLLQIIHLTLIKWWNSTS